MNKKLIIIVAIALTLIIGLVIANNVIGKSVAESVDRQLKALIAEAQVDSELEVQYSKVTASPLFGTVKIHDLKAQGEEIFGVVTAKRMDLSMPIAEILRVAGDKEIKTLTEVSVTLINPNIAQDSGEGTLIADYMRLEYSGELSLFEIQSVEDGTLPTTRQSVMVEAEGMRLEGIDDLAESFGQMIYSDQIKKQFSEKGDFRLKVSFDPYKKQLKVDDWYTQNSYSKLNGSMTMDFRGETFEGFKPISVSFELDSDTDKYKTDLPAVGSVAMKSAEMHLKGDLDLRGQKVLEVNESLLKRSQLSYQISVKELELAMSEEAQDVFAQSGTPLFTEDFLIKEIKIDFKNDENGIDIQEITINIRDQINMNAIFKLEYEEVPDVFSDEMIEELMIKSSKITLSDLSENIQEFLDSMEADLPKPFLREGSKIVIELYGSVFSPTIKGVTD